MKKILIIALLLASSSAYAQQAGCINATPCVQTNTFIPRASSSLSVTSTSARVAVPDVTQQTIVVTNTGASAAYVAIGTSSVVATTSSIPLAVGQTVAFATGTTTYIAGITASGSATFAIQSGSGVPVVIYGGNTINGTVTIAPQVTSPVTMSSGTITTGGTFQTVLAANASRTACLLDNTSTHTGYVYWLGSGTPTLLNSMQLAPGQTFVCQNPGGSVAKTAIQYTTGTTSDPYVVTENN